MNDPVGSPYIASLDLTALDVPARATNWQKVVKFAATFDLQSELPDGTDIAGVADTTTDSTIPELRMALYAEWRRYNHFGHDPDFATIQQTQTELDLLRAAIV